MFYKWNITSFFFSHLAESVTLFSTLMVSTLLLWTPGFSSSYGLLNWPLYRLWVWDTISAGRGERPGSGYNGALHGREWLTSQLWGWESSGCFPGLIFWSGGYLCSAPASSVGFLCRSHICIHVHDLHCLQKGEQWVRVPIFIIEIVTKIRSCPSGGDFEILAMAWNAQSRVRPSLARQIACHGVNHLWYKCHYGKIRTLLARIPLWPTFHVTIVIIIYWW